MCFLKRETLFVVIFLTSAKSCPTPDAVYTPPPPPSDGYRGGSCKIPNECGAQQICTKIGICQTPDCSTDADCEAKTDHPVKCECDGIKSVCVPQLCNSNDNCTRLGEGYKCYMNQCKPTYGNCSSTCQCVGMYGLQQGEGICEENNCFCRTPHLSECMSIGTFSSPHSTEATSPPETEATSPPRTEATSPPGTEATSPPGTEVTSPTGTKTTIPPGTQATSPPGTETTNPPGTEATSPPGTEVTSPPGTQTTSFSGAYATSPPGTEATSPPGTEVTSPPGTQTSSSPGTQTSSPPRTYATSPAGTEATNPSGTKSTSPLGTEATIPQGTEVTSPPGTEITSTLGTKATSPPGTEATSPPGTESTSPLGTEASIPPGTETTSPLETETSTPESQYTSSPETEATSPLGSQYTSPPGTEAASSAGTEATSPPVTEAASPQATQYTSSLGTQYTSPPGTQYTIPPGTQYTSPPETEATSPPGTQYTSPPETEASSPPGTQYTSPPVSQYTSPPGTQYTSPPETEATSPPGTEASTSPGTQYISSPGTQYISSPGTQYTIPPEAQYTSQPGSQFTIYGPDTCIIPPFQGYGTLNDTCSVQSACNQFSDFVCSMDNGTNVGFCKQIPCTTDADCYQGSSFPMECGGSYCRKKDCSNTDCPMGYGCYSDGQCKKILGECNFLCDCGECPDLDCYKNQCFCINDYDDCGIPAGLPNPPVEGFIVPKIVHEQCFVAECPVGWVKTNVGCYNLISEPSSFEDAKSRCESQNGYLAKVDSKKEMEELLSYVLMGDIEAWIGLTNIDGVVSWLVDSTPCFYSPITYIRIEPDPLKSCVQTISTNWQNSVCTSLLPGLCEINPSNKYKKTSSLGTEATSPLVTEATSPPGTEATSTFTSPPGTKITSPPGTQYTSSPGTQYSSPSETPYTSPPGSQFTIYGPDTCIIPPFEGYGSVNDTCSVQSACYQFYDLVCTMDNGTNVGFCKQIPCTTDADCYQGSSFPMECGGGSCRKKDCSNTDCPMGYGCYSDGQCKKILGECNFLCDCGECPDLDCYKNQCFCTNDYDDCGIPSELPNPSVEGFFVPKIVHDQCFAAECPVGWVKTNVGCYKLISEPSSFEDAKSRCEAQKGCLVKVDSKKEMEELLMYVLDMGNIEAWIGLINMNGVTSWLVDSSPLDYSPNSYIRMEPDPVKTCVQTMSTNWQNSVCTSLLPALCEINPRNKYKK